MKPLLAMFALSTLAAISAEADEEPVSDAVLIPVSGTLTNATGTPVSGNITVHFSLYEHALVTDAVWEEDVDISVEDGRFATQLGSVVPLTATTFQEHADLHLAMTVAGDTELGRWPLTWAPYAAFATLAGDAGSVAGLTASQLVLKSDGISASMIADGSIGPGHFDFDPATQAEHDASVAGIVRQSDTIAWGKITDVPAGIADGVDETGGAANDIACSGCVSAAELDFAAATQAQLVAQLTDVIRQAQLDAALSDVVRNSGLAQEAADLVTQEALTVALADVIRQAQLAEATSNVVYASALADRLADYILRSEMDAQMSVMLQQTTFASAMADVIHTNELESELADVVRNKDLATERTDTEPTPYLVDWTQLKNVPSDFADGIDGGGSVTSDLACSGCVAASELSFDPATQAELNAHKASGDHDARYVKADDSVTGPLQVTGRTIVGMHEVTCSAGSCSCPSGEVLIGGGVSSTGLTTVQLSYPYSLTTWYARCWTLGTSTEVSCGNIHINCARFQ